MTIINDDSRVIIKLEVSRTDDARVIIYDRHMFIVQAGVIWDWTPLVIENYPPDEELSTRIVTNMYLIMIVETTL